MANKITGLELKIGADSSELKKELISIQENTKKAFDTRPLQNFVNQSNQASDTLKNIAENVASFMIADKIGQSVTILQTASKAAIKFESAMADVKKVVDFDTPKQFKEMEKDIVSLSQKIPMAAEDISKIVAAGGQSGIAREDLTKFAEDAAKMGIAFDVTADQAGEMMAKWRTAFKMGQGDVVELADKINYLGNTTAASAPKISDVVTRIGPLGAIGGVASGEIAALGASMVGTGVESEIAATGIKNLILGLTAGKSATKNQQDAFKALGMDASDMAERMQKDAKGAILDVFNALSQIDSARQAAVLSDLFGKESIGAIAPLLSNLAALKENLDRVSDSARYGGSMESEFAARAETTENQLILLKNSVEAICIQLGSVFLPYLSEGAKAMTDIAGGVADWVNQNQALVDSLLKVGAGIAAIQTARKAMSYASDGVKSLLAAVAQQQAQEIAMAQEKEAAITAEQEKQINRRIKAVEAAAAKQEKAVIDSIMKQNLSYEQQAKLIVQESDKIALKTTETAVQIRNAMTEAFQRSALAASEASASTSAALTATGNAATLAGEKIAAAHTVAAETATVATEAEARLALANEATGVAAIVAGERNVAAKTASTVATEGATVATETLTTATAVQGNTAVVSGTKTAGAMSVAQGAVVSLTKAVWALAAGWYGVAAAIAYALSQSAKTSNATAQRVGKQYNNLSDGTTFKSDGQGGYVGVSDKYQDINDELQEEPVYSTTTLEGDEDEAEAPVNNQTTFVLTPEQQEEAKEIAYNDWLNSNDPEAVAERNRQTIDAKMEEGRAKTDELLKRVGNLGTTGFGGAGAGLSNLGGGSYSGTNSAEQAAKEQARRLEHAQHEAADLSRAMQAGISKEYDTTYMQDQTAKRHDIEEKQQKIAKVKADGVDENTIKALNAELDEYAKAMDEKVANKWEQVNSQMVYEAHKASAEAAQDYLALADAEYENTLQNLQREREEKEKNLMKDKNDIQSRLLVERWYYAEVAKAEKNRAKAIQDAHKKKVSYLQEEGKLAELIAYYESDEGNAANKAESKLEGQRELASEYVKIWKEAHRTMESYIASVADTVYSSMADSLSNFVRGVKSAKDAFRDFGNAVIDMLIKIAAQRMAASVVNSFIGAFSSGSGGASSTGYSLGYDNRDIMMQPMTAFASGGIVTAPTMALIGEAGTNEAVIPLTSENLAAIGGGNRRGGGGGVTVNITNKTDSQVKVEDTKYDEGLDSYILNVVVDGASRNKGGFGRNLKTALGAQ